MTWRVCMCMCICALSSVAFLFNLNSQQCDTPFLSQLLPAAAAADTAAVFFFVLFSPGSLSRSLSLSHFLSLSLCVFQNVPNRIPSLLPNPQTDEFLAILGLDHVVTVPCPGFKPTHTYGGQGGGGGARAGAGGGGGDAGDGDGGAERGVGAAAAGEGEEAGAEADVYEIDLDAAREDPNEIQLD